jgi:hypothetical protein
MTPSEKRRRVLLSRGIHTTTVPISPRRVVGRTRKSSTMAEKQPADIIPVITKALGLPDDAEPAQILFAVAMLVGADPQQMKVVDPSENDAVNPAIRDDDKARDREAPPDRVDRDKRYQQGQPGSKGDGAERPRLTAAQLSICKQMGCSPESFAEVRRMLHRTPAEIAEKQRRENEAAARARR